ncbi:ATP-binding cassette sub- A member 1 [Podila minutissima]|uniref:ATP-binding cassette sub- A member 1 n=1 Tax=Podila minutissima TaxID=64525 RepID=A0A9P5SQL9_9FUNG|nr:ATP-binding cassette sub- A member 1 [Podila minutissima]
MTGEYSGPRRRGYPPHPPSQSENTLSLNPQPASTSHSSSSPSLIYASSRPSTAPGKWCRQLLVVCRLNCILLVRYWKSALLQTVILPLLVVGIVFGVQHAYVSGGGSVTAADNTVTTWTMEGIPQCDPEPLSNACMTLVYAPQTTETTAIMTYFQNQNQARTQQALTIESQLWQDMTAVPKMNLGIVPMPSDQFIYDYALAYPDTIQLVYYNMSHATNMSTFPGFKYSREAGDNRVAIADDPYGVLLPSMIRGLDESLITFMDPAHEQAHLDVNLRSFPRTESRNGFASRDDMLYALANLMALPACITMVMAMLRIMHEKESKCKEAMQMMGLGYVAYWVAQWLTAWIMAVVQGSVMVALGYAFQMEIFTNTNALVLWLMFVLLSYAMMLFGFLVSTWCQKSSSALAFAFALVVAALISVPIVAMEWEKLWIETSNGFMPRAADNGGIRPQKTRTWTIGFLFPFLHFARLWGQIGMRALGKMNPETGVYTRGAGFLWRDLANFQQASPVLQSILPQPITGLTFYAANIGLQALLTLYFDQVIANEHGHSRGLFFFMNDFVVAGRWILQGGNRGVEKHRRTEAQSVIPYEGRPPAHEDMDVVAERDRAVHCQRPVAIRIANLTKVFEKKGPGFFKNLYHCLCCCCVSNHKRRAHRRVNVAVDRLNLLTEPNELFALLGQNGAGKSTTMQMLYGVTDPSSGDAFLFDRAIRQDMGQIRATMGVCPQHDVLFTDLTCWEHVQLYAGIKDLPAQAFAASVNDDVNLTTKESATPPNWIRSRLEAVQLWKDRHTMASRLSGGMTHRLSTIISTIGDPHVLILDEPTTGMDPVHRRHVWTFLAQFKRGRSILLTTHSMEEADALGDKVAIMVAGHLKAIGNTTRLKNRFGNGYRVELALGAHSLANDASEGLSSAVSMQQGATGGGLPTLWQLEQEMAERTRRLVPEATLLDASGGMMVFGIPLQAISKMAGLTTMLEACQGQGKIKNWGIAQTSLEEVFLSIVRSSDDRH